MKTSLVVVILAGSLGGLGGCGEEQEPNTTNTGSDFPVEEPVALRPGDPGPSGFRYCNTFPDTCPVGEKCEYKRFPEEGPELIEACVVHGDKQVGELCNSIGQCVPNTKCSNAPSELCPEEMKPTCKVCLPLCRSDSDCKAALSASKLLRETFNKSGCPDPGFGPCYFWRH